MRTGEDRLSAQNLLRGHPRNLRGDRTAGGEPGDLDPVGERLGQYNGFRILNPNGGTILKDNSVRVLFKTRGGKAGLYCFVSYFNGNVGNGSTDVLKTLDGAPVLQHRINVSPRHHKTWMRAM